MEEPGRERGHDAPDCSTDRNAGVLNVATSAGLLAPGASVTVQVRVADGSSV